VYGIKVTIPQHDGPESSRPDPIPQYPPNLLNLNCGPIVTLGQETVHVLNMTPTGGWGAAVTYAGQLMHLGRSYTLAGIGMTSIAVKRDMKFNPDVFRKGQ
jgi:hypothetical protein